MRKDGLVVQTAQRGSKCRGPACVKAMDACERALVLDYDEREEERERGAREGERERGREQESKRGRAQSNTDHRSRCREKK